MADHSHPDLTVVGMADPTERLRQAVETYATSRYEGDPPLWPNGGVVALRPLLDELLGDNHLVRVRLARGARSARHTHDSDQVIVVVDGRGSLETDDGTVSLSSGTVVFTPKGVPHVHAAGDDHEIDYVYFTQTGHDTVVIDPSNRT